MANNISNLMFRAMYRFGFKPWDSGFSPPELKELIEGPQARTPGKALDLGCGTGTNAIYMTQHGWDVTGIDFVPRAIEAAQAKAQAAKVSPRLMVRAATKLDQLNVGEGYSLLFDLGCFHAIPQDRRDAYVAGATRAATPGADFLLWGFYRKPSWEINAMVSKEEIEQRFANGWELVRAWSVDHPARSP